jgi:hypothetical protein
MAEYVEMARLVLAAMGGTPEASLRGSARPEKPSEPAAAALSLKGHAVELWCDHAGGRVFVVADEEDAQETIQRFGAQRGEIWIPCEIELVARIEDQTIRDEVAGFKRQMDGRLSPEWKTGGRRL